MLFGFPERLFPRGKYNAHRMRVFALAISWISIVYNGIEGGVSIGLGAEVGSRALIVFGVQSVVEVLSAALVIYRFRRELEENSPPNLSLERRATLGIGILFIILTVGTWAASIVALAMHAEPDSSKPALIVSACSLVCMIFVWLPKPWIAAELNSSVMRGEAACSLACIYLTIVLFIGSLVYKLWRGGWWVDSVVAILLGFFFLYEGWEMVSWARNKEFNGGCCKTCSAPAKAVSCSNDAVISGNCNGSCSHTCSTLPVATCYSNDATTSNNCNKSCSQTCSTSPVVTSPKDTTQSDNCNGCCSRTCSTSPTAASSSNDATASDNCNKDCSQKCSTSPVVNSSKDTKQSGNCNGCCSQTCSTLPTATSSSNDATASDNCIKDCSQTCSSSPAATCCSNDATTSATEYSNVEKCECCANKKECIEAGTCVCRPLLVDKIRSNHISCCFGPTKCCVYGSTALFRL